MKALFAAWWLTTALALAQGQFEILGTLAEMGSNVPLAGVTIRLVERRPDIITGEDRSEMRRIDVASTPTNPQGEFRFTVDHKGIFEILAPVPGYEPIGARAVTVQEPGERVTIRIALIRFGFITGRVVDANDTPMAETLVGLHNDQGEFFMLATKTDREGRFTFSGVLPGSHLIQVRRASQWSVQADFTQEEADATDEGYDQYYWPGGTPEPSFTVPLNVAPGSQIDIGKIVVTRIRLPRVRIAIQGECEPGVRTTLSVFQGEWDRPNQVPVRCPGELLLKGITPGTYTVAISNVSNWAVQQIVVPRRNIAVAMTMAPLQRLAGQVIPPAGVALESLGTVHLGIQAIGMPLSYLRNGPVESDGTFLFSALLWQRQQMSVKPGDPDVYVKQIRYNGLPLPDGVFDLLSDRAMEIELGRGAAHLSGKALQPGMVAVVRWPQGEFQMSQASLPPFYQVVTADGEGNFQFDSLPPGEYQVVAFPLRGTLDRAVWNRILQQSQRVSLRAGESKELDLTRINLQP